MNSVNEEIKKADFLITSDKKHFKTQRLKEAKLPFKIVTPKEFINELYSSFF